MTPKTLGRYTIESTIGEGAMGRVYRGFDPLARRAVAIKTIREEALTSATRDDYVRRFQREAQAAASVIHPSIVTIFDVGETYFVMELVDGETLQSVLQRKGRLGPREVLQVLAPIADALDYVHGKGLVHRDIKPANIMVLPNGRAKLMDFGVVHLESSATMTSVGMAVGSPPYMAPEQIVGGEITARTDIFALGAVTYEMLSGRRAFDAENVTAVINRVVNETPPPLRDEVPSIPEHFETMIGRAMAKDPGTRPATAMEFVAALHRGLDGTSTGERPASVRPEAHAPSEPRVVRPDAATVDLTVPTPRPEDTRRRGKSAVVVVAAVVLAAAVGLVVRGGFSKTATPPAVASPSASAAEATPTDVPAPPPVNVDSAPSGGAVFLDDKEAGKTPLELAIAPGEHVVRVTHEGFASGQLQITVTAEGHPPLRFDLDPVTAALSVRSDPSGARASIDGREVGTTPVETLAVYPGAHRITVGLAGYTPWVESFEATAGKPVELIAHLKPVPRRQPKNVASTPEPTPPPPVREGDLVTLGPGVTPPRKVSGKSAFYPSAALAKRLQGKVTVELVVTETGEPKDLRVVESAGPLLDDVVLDAIRSWRYEPAVKDGVKVRVVIRESQSFELRAPK